MRSKQGDKDSMQEMSNKGRDEVEVGEVGVVVDVVVAERTVKSSVTLKLRCLSYQQISCDRSVIRSDILRLYKKGLRNYYSVLRTSHLIDEERRIIIIIKAGAFGYLYILRTY